MAAGAAAGGIFAANPRADAGGPGRGGRRGADLQRRGGPAAARERARLRRPGADAERRPRGRPGRRGDARQRRGSAPRPRPLRPRGHRRRPLRRRHQRGRRRRAAARLPLAAAQPRSRRPARRRRRPPLADRDARRRPARAGGGGGAGPRGADAGPLPAVLRVRDDRRLRGDPFRRPGFEWLWPLRFAGQLGADAGTSRRPADAGNAAHGRRAFAARADRRLRRGAGGDPGGDREGAAAAVRAPLRGLDGRELRGRHGDRPRPRPGAWAAGHHPRLRRGGDRELAGALGPARPRRTALRRLSRPAQPP
jgi:hypothetical protein